MTIRSRTGSWLLLAAAVLAALFTLLLDRNDRRQHGGAAWDHPLVERDLDLIKADTLRVLVMHDALSWKPGPGGRGGLDMGLMAHFASHAGLAMKVLPMDDRDSMYLALQRGDGDVIAAQFGETPEERGWFRCSEPYMLVRPMIARLREGMGSPPAPNHVDGVAVSRWSPLRSGVHHGQDTPAMRELPATPEELLVDVLLGRIGSCVVSDAMAAYQGARLPALEFIPAEGPSYPLCFAMRTNAPRLATAMDGWMHDGAASRFRSVLVGTYDDRPSKPGALRRPTMPARSDSISPYDDEFRAYGQGSGWKWQLLAAMAWKESRFDSTAVSRRGALGIMQFMPNTAQRLGVDTSVAVAGHIRAANAYIMRLDTLWMRAVPDRDQRLRFVLASYNAGHGHIIDAQRLAQHLGLDPARWEGHVERAVLLLADPRFHAGSGLKNGYCDGSQVFHYVREVLALYHQLTGLDQAPEQAEMAEADSVDPVPDVGVKARP